MPHTVGKLSMRATTFHYTSLQSEVYTQSYKHPKLRESQFWELKLSLGSFKTKWHLGVGPIARHREYYNGKVMASPKFGLWWILWIHVCPWFVRAPKCANYALSNLLFGLYRSMWVIDLLVNLPSPHHIILTCPSTPKVLRAKECAVIPSLCTIFTFGFAIESIKELGGVSS
jgi:hypothetical protein